MNRQGKASRRLSILLLLLLCLSIIIPRNLFSPENLNIFLILKTPIFPWKHQFFLELRIKFSFYALLLYSLGQSQIPCSNIFNVKLKFAISKKYIQIISSSVKGEPSSLNKSLQNNVVNRKWRPFIDKPHRWVHATRVNTPAVPLNES